MLQPLAFHSLTHTPPVLIFRHLRIYENVVGQHADRIYDDVSAFGEAMANLIGQPVGIDRCQRSLHTLFAVELIEQGKFVWRRRSDHEWEVGRWPGLELTLLAEPEWQSRRVPFAICPFPGSDGSVPFILLIAFQSHTGIADLTTHDLSVSISTVTTVELQRDARMCAHQIFDNAVWLQLPYLEARCMGVNRRVSVKPSVHDLKLSGAGLQGSD